MRRPLQCMFGILLIAVAVLLASVGWAQEVGTIAELEGRVDIGRAGRWMPAAINLAVAQGDTLRTGRPGRLRVVFRDDSVLTAADESEITVDEQLIDANSGVAHSVLALVRGKVRALVSESYGRPGSVYNIQTPTAVVGVRGTEFVITFDPVGEVTDVVGVEGRVEVHSVLDQVRHAVFVTTQEISTVARGRYPTPARRLDDELFRQYLDKLGFIGAGKPESVVAGLPLLSGAVVPDPDRVSALPGPSAGLVPGVPGSIAPAVPGDSVSDIRDAGQLIGQAPSVLEATQSRIGIHF